MLVTALAMLFAGALAGCSTKAEEPPSNCGGAWIQPQGQSRVTLVGCDGIPVTPRPTVTISSGSAASIIGLGTVGDTLELRSNNESVAVINGGAVDAVAPGAADVELVKANHKVCLKPAPCPIVTVRVVAKP